MRRLTRTTLALLGVVFCYASTPAHAQCINGQCSTRGAAMFSGYRVIPQQTSWQSAPQYSVPLQAPVVYQVPQAPTLLAPVPVVHTPLNANGCTTGCTCGCNAGGSCACGNPKPATTTPAAKPETKPATTAKPEARPADKPTSRSVGQEKPPAAEHAHEGDRDLPLYATNGIESEKLSPQGTETVWIGATPLITGPNGSAIDQIPDLTKACYVSVVSKDKAERARICNELRATTLGRTCAIQGFDPGAWQLEGFKLNEDQRFRDSGLALFVEQAPAAPGGLGKMLLAEYAYPGAEAFARRVDPLFDPNRTPAAPSAGWTIGDILPWALGLGILAVIAITIVAGGLLALAIYRTGSHPDAPDVEAA